MFKIAIANDTLSLWHFRCLLAAMRSSKAIILYICERISEEEEGKCAQSQIEWDRHDERADQSNQGNCDEIKQLQNSLCFNATVKRKYNQFNWHQQWYMKGVGCALREIGMTNLCNK